MKILILGGGVIGVVHAWLLQEAGHTVTVLVRPEQRQAAAQDGFHIRGTDERRKPAAQIDRDFHPAVVDDLTATAGYDLILVCVRSHQVEGILPMLAAGAGPATVLFFQNNWHGEAEIREHLAASQYLFGFSRLVGGWRTGRQVECILFNGPGQVTMLGEADGRSTPRLQQLAAAFRQAGLRPEISGNILSWMGAHYVEYLGAVGGILRAGSAAAFANDRALVREAILATREGLAVCRARGLDLGAAPFNLKMFALPLFLIVPLGQMNYRLPAIQQFFEENIAHGRDELLIQYQSVMQTARRLQVPVPHLAGFEKFYASREPLLA